ncbi:hypothetical protein SCHPADRAFT_940121 [Schizopora paradoxa]|uniref:DUF6534 domain-containing protein n=1 Tax=Schizopora paradoxa TaxID=27342 RepID=A0A0H2RPJ8_9AGAM|nr:hypothetical protein SCHPADRAFT_940121 [Schizopora paradoxa]
MFAWYEYLKTALSAYASSPGLHMITPTIDNTVGAAFVGCFLSAILFGVTITQFISYFQNRQKDSLIITWVVIATLISDTFLTSLIAYSTYLFSVKSLENSKHLFLFPWSSRLLILITGISVALVRCFFIRRIWFLSDKRVIVTGIQVILTIGAFVSATVAGARVMLLETLEQFSDSQWVVYSTRSTNIVADISIVGTTLYYLYKTTTGFKGTGELLNALILFVLGTGIVSVVWDILEASTYAASSNTDLFTIFFFSSSKLYVNALLASLNARHPMQKKLRSSLVMFSGESRGSGRTSGIPSFRPASGQVDLELALPPQVFASSFDVRSSTSSLEIKVEGIHA